MNAGRLTALAALTASTLLMTACNPMPAQDVPDMGGAVAEKSPASADPVGRIIDPDPAWSGITDMELAGETIGLRAGDRVLTGTLAAFDSGDATEVEVPGTCGDLNASADTFVLACGDEVLLIDAATGDVTRRDLSGTDAAPAVSAALTSTGELVVGNSEEAQVVVFEKDATEPARTIKVAGHTTQIIAVPVEGEADSVVRINHANTTIQDVHWQEGKQGGTLRVGMGVGRITAGTDGLVLASDNMGGQLSVYTATDVVRLHQTGPVPASPWGVAWDAERELAWITATGDNTLQAFDISTGVPVQKASLDTVADAQNIVVLEDGTLILASATGEGLQVIENPDISS